MYNLTHTHTGTNEGLIIIGPTGPDHYTQSTKYYEHVLGRYISSSDIFLILYASILYYFPLDNL